jgi:subtilase family serine protease
LTKFTLSLVACATALAFPVGAALAGTPYPTKMTPKAVDAGTLSTAAAAQMQTVTIAMKLHDLAGAQALFAALNTQGSPQFHQFITPEEFKQRFAPTAAEVAKVSAALEKFGLSVTQATSTTLSVKGTPAQLERAFAVSLHQYNVPAKGGVPGFSFHAPTSEPTVPAEAADLVHAVIGLDTRPRLHPNMHRSVDKMGIVKRGLTPKTAPTTTANPPGELTVADFAALYDVNPLYNKGITGAGKTLGIVTLANFTPSDAFAYWSAVGLKVDPKRITQVEIDGGPGAPSDASGSDETTLDVEQSGGVAPGAKIIVYQAPNTSQGFLDAFAQAIDSNKADTISTSWGEWEFFDTKDYSPVTDPYTGNTVAVLRAYNEVFLQAALQGQSLFASAGDSGAYDVNDAAQGIVPPDFTLTLSVDSPASDPYITAAGGTTLPGTQVYCLDAACDQTYPITIKKERVWSWDYLDPLIALLGLTPIEAGTFPVGGGGGVSVEFSRPLYQLFIPGMKSSQPKQAFTDNTQTPPFTYFNLPANYPGRNLPDLSFNADPDTGYLIYYTSDQSGPEILSFIGGTSFVAPQLNGVASLLNQSQHGRLGLLNVPAYFMSRFGGYVGKKAPLNAITTGNNEFYTGSNGYNPGAGLGTMDVANFAEALKNPFGL